MMKQKLNKKFEEGIRRFYELFIRDTSFMAGFGGFIYTMLFSLLITLFIIGIKTEAILGYFHILISFCFIAIFIRIIERIVSRPNGIYQIGISIYIAIVIIGLLIGNYTLHSSFISPIFVFCFWIPLFIEMIYTYLGKFKVKEKKK